MDEPRSHQDTPPEELQAIVARARGIVRRGWRLFLVTAVLTAIVLQAAAFFWPGTFEAKAAVLLQRNRFGTVLDADAQAPPTVIEGTVSQEEVNSEIAVLTSAQVLTGTAQAAGLDKLPPPWYLRLLFAPLRGYERMYSWFHEVPAPTQATRAVTGLADAIAVERLKDSNILVVSYRAGDPRMAEIVLDELLRRYQEWHVRVHGQGGAQPFYSDQVTLLQTSVRELQKQLQATKDATGVVDLSTAREVAIKELATLEGEQRMLTRRARELDGRILGFERILAETPRWMRTATRTRSGAETLNQLRQQVLQLELEGIQLRTRFRDDARLAAENTVKLEKARAAFAQASAAIDEEATSESNPTVVAVEQDLVRLRSEKLGVAERLTAVGEQVRALRERARLLDSHLVEVDQLQMQLTSARTRYMTYLDRSEKARIDAALDGGGMTNVSVVQRAAASLKPVRPKRLISFLVAIGGGLLMGVLTVLWREATRLGTDRVLASALPAREGEA